jgi:hypothetical protein
MKPGTYPLMLHLRSEPRFAKRKVPTVDLWACGPGGIFHRLSGIVDSGATRTLLGDGARDLLGIERDGPIEKMDGIRGEFRYELHWVQFRVHALEGPPVTVWIYAGLIPSMVDNLFGADLLEYYTIAVARDGVTFMAN